MNPTVDTPRPCQWLGAGPHWAGNPHPDPVGEDVAPPSAFIQWKGTDVCLDFYCPCGNSTSGHYDGYFAYALRCVDCGRVFAMPSIVPLIEIGPEHIHHDMAQVTQRDIEDNQ